MRSRLKLKKNRPCYFEIERALLDQPDGQRHIYPIHQPWSEPVLPFRPELSRCRGANTAQEGALVSIVDEFCYEENDRSMRAITYGLATPIPVGTFRQTQ